MKKSVLGVLATRFTSSPENLATEALNFILGESAVLRDDFVEFINQAGCDIALPLTFSTQSTGEDNAIPDLVGTNGDGKQTVIAEAKFWAGLTDNQPLTYIKRMPNDENAILLFIAPAKRFHTLWPELKLRCAEANIILGNEKSLGEEFIASKINDHHFLALCSWRSINNHLSISANRHGLLSLSGDIQQLEGLCNRMDSEAFLPIQSTELSSGNGLRYLHYHQVVDATVEKLVSEKIVSRKGLRATPAYGKYTRYIKTETHGMGLQFNCQYWSEIQETPIWLSVQEIVGKKWVNSSSIKKKLHSLELLNPPKIIEYHNEILIPIYIPIGKEKGEVVNALFGQIVDVINLLD